MLTIQEKEIDFNKDSYWSKSTHNRLLFKLNDIFQKEQKINIKSNLSIGMNYFETVNTIFIYKGLILKLKISFNIKESLFKINQNITLSKKIPIKNILIFKSDTNLNINAIKTNYKINQEINDSNELIANFIDNYFIKNDINIIFSIGCGIEDSIKEIILSYNLFYFEWLNWKNYQVKN